MNICAFVGVLIKLNLFVCFPFVWYFQTCAFCVLNHASSISSSVLSSSSKKNWFYAHRVFLFLFSQAWQVYHIETTNPTVKAAEYAMYMETKNETPCFSEFVVYHLIFFPTSSQGGGRVRHNTTVFYPIYYADDDMFRPLWAVFRSQKCIQRKTIQSMIIVQVHIVNCQRDLFCRLGCTY